MQSNFRYVVLFLLMISSIALFAKELDYLNDLPPLIERDLFFGDPDIAGAQISPNGEYISFLKPYNNVRNIYVKKRGEPFEAARPVTADDRPVSGYFWSQDSRYILYVQDKGGNENFHVYAVDPDKAAQKETGVPPAKDLTPVEGVRANIYAVPETIPDQIIVGLNQRDPSYHDVYHVSISTGERELVFENTQNIADFTFDLEGKLRLASRETEDGGTEILRFDEDMFKQIYTCGFEETCYTLRFHKEGEKVYFVTNKGHVDLTRLTLLNPQTGETELVEFDPEKEVDFGGAFFDDRTDELVATVYVGDRKRIYPKTRKFKNDLAFLKKQLPDGELSISATSEDMRYFLVGLSSDIDPGSVYLYDRKAKTVDLLYRSRPELKSEHLAHMKALRYKARDGKEIPAYLTTPRGVKTEKLPTVMLIHGGPWGRDRWGYDPYAQFLANRGYAVMQPNFRGSAGYGKDFLNAGNKEWGAGVMQHDISDAVKFLIQEGYSDPDNIAIFGGSYGGYATLAGLTFTPELYTAGISYVGPSNLLTLLKSLPPYWEPIKKMFYKRVGNPNTPEGREQLRRQSPLFHVENIDDPVLVIQGANDPRVKKQESDQIIVAGREKGLDMSYLVAPNEGHGFRQLDNRLVVAAALEKFLAEQLNGRYQKELAPDIEKRMQELKVDIDSVTMPDTSFVSDISFPAIDTDALQAFTATYNQLIESQGRKLNMNVVRTVEKSKLDGIDAWLIINRASSPQGTSVDSFYLAADHLAPLRHVVDQPRIRIVTQYSEDKITGAMQMGGQERPIHVDVEEKVLGSIDVTAMAMPLSAAFQAKFAMFNLLQQQTETRLLNVTGPETVSVPAGEFECLVVEINKKDGAEKQTLYVTQKDPHLLIKSKSDLPAMMGGGTATTELVETDLD